MNKKPHRCEHCDDPARTDRDMKLPASLHEPLPDNRTPDVIEELEALQAAVDIEEMEMARYFAMDNVPGIENDE